MKRGRREGEKRERGEKREEGEEGLEMKRRRREIFQTHVLLSLFLTRIHNRG